MLREVAKAERATGAGSRRIFAPHFKLQVLDSYRNDADCKGNQRATARKYGIHRRQIQKWLQAEGALRSSVGGGAAKPKPPPPTPAAAPPAAPPQQRPPSPPAPIDLSLKRARSPPAAWDLRVRRPAKLFKPYLDVEEEGRRRRQAAPLARQPPACCCPCCDGCYAPAAAAAAAANNNDEYYAPRPLYYYPPAAAAAYYRHPEYSIDLKLVDCYYQEAAACARRPEAEAVR